MTVYLDHFGTYLNSIGVHPVLGAFIVGFLLAALIFRRGKDSGISFGVEAGASTHLRDRLSSSNQISAVSKISSELFVSPVSSHITVNGQTLPLGGQDAEHLMRLIREGKTIEAIKTIREIGNFGLKDAKDAVEIISRGTRG